MPIALTQALFIEKAFTVHNGKYTYDKTVYHNNSTKIIITCPDHGDFEQIPASHLRGSGCKICGALARNKAKQLTTASFVQKAIAVHKGIYTYDNVQYINSTTKVAITCPIHGDFMQTPNNHLSGMGCQSCAKITTQRKQALPQHLFISRAKSIHGNRYEYSRVQYVNSKIPVEIVCPDHGVFLQSPGNHTHKTIPQGCPTCSSINSRYKNGWTYTEWESAGINSSYFDGFKLYIVRCWSENEQFIKIGKTYRELHSRFKPSCIPYEWELLKLKEGSAKYISELECTLHTSIKTHSYIPIKSFGGQYECYTIASLDEITQIMETLCKD